MAILVTGGAGFIGSNIVDMLIEEGYNVVVVDNLSTGNKENLNKDATFYEVDIVDDKSLTEVFTKENIDAILHLAAQANVRKSIEDPIFDTMNNVVGSINLLEAAQKNDVGKFVFASSGGAIYGEPKELPTDEDHPVEPLCHYGAAKYSIEKYMDVYRSLYGIRTVALRYSNVYGPRQDPFGEAGVVAIFANKILKGERPKIFGDGEQTRDFVYVRDVAKANLTALEMEISGAFNIGTGVETSVNEITDVLLKKGRAEIEPLHSDPVPGEVRHIYLDVSKVKEELGWEPKVDLEEGIREYISWLKG